MIFLLKDNTEYTLPEPLYKDFCEEYPLIDVDVELEKMRKWLKFNDSRRKTKRGMKRAINHWLSNDSIPKTKRKVAPVSHDQWAGKAWLKQATVLDMNNNASFRAMLGNDGFRGWAEAINPLCKEMK